MPEIETPHELAIRVLRENKGAIAEGIYKLTCKLAVRWANVDRSAFVHNAGALLDGVTSYMDGGDVEYIFRFGKDAMAVRRLGGFNSVDFNIMVHAYLPVMRKAMLSCAPSLRQGIAAYDAVEAVCLALIARIVEAIARADEITSPDAQPPFHGRPFETISVDEQMPAFMRDVASDDDSLEEQRTEPNAKFPLRR